MTKQDSQAAYLQQHKAWNWRWPDARNRWHTNARVRGKKQAYSGPSKRTRDRRARRGNSGHSYN